MHMLLQLPVIMPPVAPILIPNFIDKSFSSVEQYLPKWASFCCLQSWMQNKGGKRVCCSLGITFYSVSRDETLNSVNCCLQKQSEIHIRVVTTFQMGRAI